MTTSGFTEEKQNLTASTQKGMKTLICLETWQSIPILVTSCNFFVSRDFCKFYYTTHVSDGFALTLGDQNTFWPCSSWLLQQGYYYLSLLMSNLVRLSPPPALKLMQGLPGCYLTLLGWLFGYVFLSFSGRMVLTNVSFDPV